MAQLMRIASLDETRLREARCAGLFAFKAGRGQFPAAASAGFARSVAAAVANDADLPPDLAQAFVDQYADEVASRQAKLPEDGARADLAAAEAECAALADALARGQAPALAPLVDRGLVDPTFATCHALYSVAADKASAADRPGLQKLADRAAALALGQRSGEDRDRAARALADAVAAEREEAALAARSGRDAAGDQQRAMMRLVACLPMMEKAAK